MAAVGAVPGIGRSCPNTSSASCSRSSAGHDEPAAHIRWTAEAPPSPTRATPAASGSIRLRMFIPVRYRMGIVDRNRLSREDWARQALGGIARGGVDGVSVEGLARELGVTKGSFYWHFSDRPDLIGAALELWEQEATLDVIDQVNAVADVRDRLFRLFEISFGDLRDGPVDAALVAQAGDPLIGPVVERVNQTRLRFLEATYRELGLTRLRAARQARIAYSTYVGHFLVRRAVPGDEHLHGISPGYLRQLLQSIVP